MKQKILLLFIIFFSLKVQAKKDIFPLTLITASADLIVIGEIDMVKNNTYLFKIGETLKGQKYRTISVKMFEEWTCDNRFEKPKKGQKLFLFLKKGQKEWKIINGSSGEMFISDNLIYLGGEDSMKIVNNKITRNDMSLTEFKNTIKDFCKCYVFIGDGDYRNPNPQYYLQICSDRLIAEFENRSKFSTKLFEEMKSYRVKKLLNELNFLLTPSNL
ncbi:MAG: hypothetical protein RLZZ540_643 [Bacteroidota bacterium]|jgi:hypothetical protein